jgi:heterodisulfide reductase subunit B
MKSLGEVGLFFPTRNLMLAEQTGQTHLVMPCNVCYHELSRANTILREESDRREAVNDLLAKAGEPTYRGTVKERHLLEFIYNEVGMDRIRSLVKRPLTGLKVAPYYGCLYTRPSIFTGTDRRDPKLDDAERPYFMHRILEAIGCIISDYNNETACCGGRNVMQDPDTSMLLSAETLSQAKEAMGDVMSLICPKCAGAMDINQPKIVEKYGQKTDLPVVFFTQLMGLAFGESRRRMKFAEMTTDADEAIRRAGFD